MKHLILIAAVLLTGCASDVAQVLGDPLGFETRDHRVARLNGGPVLPPMSASVKHANGDTNGDGFITLEEQAAAKGMSAEQYTAYVQKDQAELYDKHRRSYTCDKAASDAQRLACVYAEAGVDVVITSDR